MKIAVQNALISVIDFGRRDKSEFQRHRTLSFYFPLFRRHFYPLYANQSFCDFFNNCFYFKLHKKDIFLSCSRTHSHRGSFATTSSSSSCWGKVAKFIALSSRTRYIWKSTVAHSIQTRNFKNFPWIFYTKFFKSFVSREMDSNHWNSLFNTNQQIKI